MRYGSFGCGMWSLYLILISEAVFSDLVFRIDPELSPIASHVLLQCDTISTNLYLSMEVIHRTSLNDVTKNNFLRRKKGVDLIGNTCRMLTWITSVVESRDIDQSLPFRFLSPSTLFCHSFLCHKAACDKDKKREEHDHISCFPDEIYAMNHVVKT